MDSFYYVYFDWYSMPVENYQFQVDVPAVFATPTDKVQPIKIQKGQRNILTNIVRKMITYVLKLKCNLYHNLKVSSQVRIFFKQCQNKLKTSPINYWNFKKFVSFVKSLQVRNRAATICFFDFCLIYLRDERLHNIMQSKKIKQSNIQAHMKYKRMLQEVLMSLKQGS